MFTVEMEEEDCIVTTLDEEGLHEDVELLIDRDGDVWVRQFDSQSENYDLVCMSRNQFLDLLAAWNSSEGAYFIKRENYAKNKG